ncbi:MAG: outer membrane beta-barrel protein [Bacteroidia bacterium]
MTNLDTIKGLIDLRKLNNPNPFISLKIGGADRLISLNQINTLIIKTKTQVQYYKPLIVQLNLSSNDLNNLNTSPLPKFKLSNDPEPKFIKDTILAQVIVGGQKKLFQYIDNNVRNTHYLIVSNEGKPIDLIYHRYYMDKGMTKIGYNEEYKSQLLSNLTDCNQINFESINKVKFIESDLTSLFINYNKCVNSKDSIYVVKNEKIKTHFGIIIGFNRSKLHFESAQSKINQTNLNPSIGPNFGFYANIVFPKANKSWSIYNELLFNQFKYIGTGYNIYYENPTWYSKINDVEIKASVIKLFTAIRYQFSKYKLKPFIQLGIGNGLAFSYSSKCTTETRFNSNVNFETKSFIEFRKHEQSLFSGIGINYKRIGLECRYEVGNGMSQASGILSKTKYLYILLNFRF